MDIYITQLKVNSNKIPLSSLNHYNFWAPISHSPEYLQTKNPREAGWIRHQMWAGHWSLLTGLDWVLGLYSTSQTPLVSSHGRPNDGLSQYTSGIWSLWFRAPEACPHTILPGTSQEEPWCWQTCSQKTGYINKTSMSMSLAVPPVFTHTSKKKTWTRTSLIIATKFCSQHQILQ